MYNVTPENRHYLVRIDASLAITNRPNRKLCLRIGSILSTFDILMATAWKSTSLPIRSTSLTRGKSNFSRRHPHLLTEHPVHPVISRNQQ